MKPIQSLEQLFNAGKVDQQLIDHRFLLWEAITLFCPSIHVLHLLSKKKPSSEWYISPDCFVLLRITINTIKTKYNHAKRRLQEYTMYIPKKNS